MARLSSWLRAFFRWLFEPQLAWTTSLVVVLALVVSLRAGVNEVDIRATGLALQWLGIGTVAYGVRKTRKLFGSPGLTLLLRGWLSRFPRWRGRVISVLGPARLGLKGGVARLQVWMNVDPKAPIESRVEALTKNVDRLRDELNQVRNELDKEVRQQSEALSGEAKARAAGDKHLHQRLEAAETGGLHITFAGVIWLFLGVLLATLSPEIAQWRS